MSSRGGTRKRKARDHGTSIDDDEPVPPTTSRRTSTRDEPPEPPTMSRRTSTRDRTLTEKQEAVNKSQNEQLQARIQKLERENAKLRKHKPEKAKSGVSELESEDDDDLDKLPVESEEESDSIVEFRSMKSKFESRGIYDTEPTKAKKLRRMDDPAARLGAVTPATASSAQVLRSTSRAPEAPPIPALSRRHGSSRSRSPPLSEPDTNVSYYDGASPPPPGTATPPDPPPSQIPPRHRRALDGCGETTSSGPSQPGSQRHTSASTPPEADTSNIGLISRTSPSPPPRARTVPPPARSHRSAGSSSQSQTPQLDSQASTATEDLPFRGGIKPTGDAKASDYEPHATRLILAACRHFEARVLTDDPFPDEEKMEPWVQEAWTHTSDTVRRYYKLPDRVKKLIMSRTSHARGALKDCIRPLVAPKYGFSSTTDEATKLANRTLYERLLDINNPEGPEPIFHYQNIDRLVGFARNEIISHAIRDQWFRNSDGVGLRLSERFSPIREETLAIIFTAIEFCLDQWADGSLSDGARFTEKDYKPKYENHLRLIKAWTEIDPVVTERIRQQMYEEARLASGAAPVRATVFGLSASSRSRLQAELDEFAKSSG